MRNLVRNISSALHTIWTNERKSVPIERRGCNIVRDVCMIGLTFATMEATFTPAVTKHPAPSIPHTLVKVYCTSLFNHPRGSMRIQLSNTTIILSHSSYTLVTMDMTPTARTAESRSEGFEGFQSPFEPSYAQQCSKVYALGSAILCIAIPFKYACNQNLAFKPLCIARKSKAWPSLERITRSRAQHRATAPGFSRDSKHGRNRYSKLNSSPNYAILPPDDLLQHQREKKLDAFRRQACT